MSTTTDTTTRVYQVWIRATPERIWEAITDPTGRSSTATRRRPSTTCAPAATTACIERAMKEYGSPNVIVEGEVIESDPPRGWCRPGTRCSAPRWRPSRPRG